MPQKKYVLVEGVTGPKGLAWPVTNPHAPSESPPRFAGLRLKPLTRAEAESDTPRVVDHLVELYEPAPEVLEDHAHLHGARRDGHLKILGDCVAASHDEARSKLQPDTTPSRGDA